jgi:hypothetical protein
MPIDKMQPSFAGGELAPSLGARVDLAKYNVGAKTLHNFFVLASGGVSNRPGTQYVGRVRNTNQPVRLIPFRFNLAQDYVLEFGHQYMRVIINGGYVLEPAITITGISKAAPGQVTAPAHGYSNGDSVFIAAVTGMTQINSSTSVIYLVANVTTNTFTLTDLDGNAINTTGFGAYVSGGTVARLYTLTTPYAGSDLALLKYTQSNDVMTLSHTGYGPYDLTRTQHWSWSLTLINFQADISAPGSLTLVNSTGAGSWYYSYMVTAVSSDSEESIGSAAITKELTQLNQNTGVQNTIGWAAVTNAQYYKVYATTPSYNTAQASGAIYGYIGQTYSNSFIDTNISPDFTLTPPQGQNPFASNNNPGCVSYFQERKVFAGSNLDPESLWMTQSGAFTNMDTSNPSRDSDAITIAINTQQVNAIKHLVSVNALLALTSSGAFKISNGTVGGAVTPSSIQANPQAYNGCCDVPPIVVGNDILYIQARGAKVRDLSYNFYADIYTGSDMTVLSPHLFYGHQILEWAYAEEPFKLIWAVRDDGDLLGFTYLKEQDVYAWTHHDSPGNSGSDSFLSVASIPEGQEDATYFVISRTIPGINGGQPVKYVERLHTRNFLTNWVADVTRAWFVDCGMQYSGTPTTTVSGLNHLNGATVNVLADGNVILDLVVANGTITLAHAASTITVGLPYTADMQTLSLDLGEPSTQGRFKKITAVTMVLENTRGLKVGPNQSNLTEVKERSTQAYGLPIGLITGKERILIQPSWSKDACVWISQQYPLPATILGIIPEIRVGSTPDHP